MSNLMCCAWVSRRVLVVAAVCVGLASCGDDAAFGVPGGGTATTTSELCEGIVGAEAILWDLYNGIPRTDPVLPPALPTPAETYGHPGQPILGFQYPVGWTPQTIDNGLHEFGVNLLRNDNSAVWRQFTRTAQGAPSPRDIRDVELDTMRAQFGLTGAQATTVCVNERSFDAGGGFQMHISNIMVRVGTHTAVVVSSVTPFPSLGTSSTRRQVVAAPTDEFQARALDTFLAIDFQMLVGDNRNLFDRDGDGWRDGVDEAPDDPTRH